MTEAGKAEPGVDLERLESIRRKNNSDDSGRWPSWHDVKWLLDEVERLQAQLAEAQPQPTPSECGYVIPVGSWKSRVCRLPQGHDGEHAPSEQTTETE